MANEHANVLVVDDEPLNTDLLEQELADAGYLVRVAASGEQALEMAGREEPDLILLDVRMRGIDGYETCRRLKAEARTRTIPVIFLTVLSDTFDKVSAFGCGAVDYVTKPFVPEELLARVATHVALRREIDAHQRSRETIRQLVDVANSHPMLGDSPAWREVRTRIGQVATTDAAVLILGETGSGKEVVARALHAQSHRASRPLVRLNCAAIAHELVESELFGHEKGAFTGAAQQRRGRFELADGGTLLLDEVGELPLALQPKLLRVLQEGEFERVGGTRTLRCDVRVIAATNRDLQAAVAEGRFRADLYYRLDVFPIRLPPLRDRREDIPELLRHFAARSARRLGRTAPDIGPGLIARAQAHDWPGNVRELEHFVERGLIASVDGHLDGAALPAPTATPERPSDAAVEWRPVALDVVEKLHIERVLQSVGGRIEGAGGAAELLGLNASTLRGRLRKLGIRRAS